MLKLNLQSAIVLFSDGQDSTTCLAWALHRFDHVETVGFDCGQRHEVELVARQRVLGEIKGIRCDWPDRLGDDHVVDLRVIGQISETALTHDDAIAVADSGLPTTFVPGRGAAPVAP
jgi:7-cyano-7-deazaguanine synthase